MDVFGAMPFRPDLGQIVCKGYQQMPKVVISRDKELRFKTFIVGLEPDVCFWLGQLWLNLGFSLVPTDLSIVSS